MTLVCTSGGAAQDQQDQCSPAAGPGLGCVQLYSTAVKAHVELSLPSLCTSLGIPEDFPVIILSMPLTYTIIIELQI